MRACCLPTDYLSLTTFISFITIAKAWPLSNAAFTITAAYDPTRDNHHRRHHNANRQRVSTSPRFLAAGRDAHCLMVMSFPLHCTPRSSSVLGEPVPSPSTTKLRDLESRGWRGLIHFQKKIDHSLGDSMALVSPGTICSCAGSVASLLPLPSATEHRRRQHSRESYCCILACRSGWKCLSVLGHSDCGFPALLALDKCLLTLELLC